MDVQRSEAPKTNPASSICGLIACAILFCAPSFLRADEAPQFFRGINLNGPGVTIDGYVWEGQDSPYYICHDNAFENQSVALNPETDAERAKMIRSSRWGGNRVELVDLPKSTYTLFLYVWEDNNSETYSVAVNGRTVEPQYESGAAGHWQKLGPWYTQPIDGKIILTSQGGAANFSGIEIWRGEYDGLDPTLSEPELAFFESRIRPLLINHCYECHSAESEEPEGELLVDSRAALRRGGAGGPAIVPGDLASSRLIEAIKYENPELQMPPDGKLSDEQIADLERWVTTGAPDPRLTPTKHTGRRIDVAAARDFWSLRPIRRPTVPAVKESTWPTSDVDRFVLAKLEEQGLAPAADADKRVLIRRATFDLIGLPPTPDEVNAFLEDQSQDAFARVVDRLIASPRYGERWGRHWMDVVRYADTAGDNSDYPIPQMRRYRDWIIQAFNRDLPFDEFVRDQLAGDLRGAASEHQRYERVIATGYIAASRRFGSRVSDYPQHLTIEDTIDNLGRAFLGMTLSCARCHDHKFDPIATRDYYALFGIFHSTRYPWPGIELEKRQRDFVPLIPEDQRANLEQAQVARNQQQSQLDEAVNQLKKQIDEAPESEKSKLAEQLKEAERLARVHREQPPLYETAYAVAEMQTPSDVAIHLRGDPTKLGDVVPRRFLEVLGGDELPAGFEGSGRQQLAEWIVADDNPLTARVIVNRIWQYHFGRGIVATPNDFGRQGKPPTHPELLDYLAQKLRDEKWSIKSVHRLIMLSRSYQQSSVRDPRAITLDPANEWLAGYPRRRLDAEPIRDALLMLGENLDLTAPGPHPFPPEYSWDFTQHEPFKDVYPSNHRTVYLMTQRIQRHPYLAIFDGADPSTSTGVRSSSTTPLQALFLLNDPFVHDQARLVVQRICRFASDESDRVHYAYELLLSRLPSPEELAAALQFLTEARCAVEQGLPVSDIQQEAWTAFVRAMFRLNEFVYLE